MILEEVKEFLKNILHWVYALLGFALFFFTFGHPSFAVQVFKKIQYDLLPKGVSLVVTNPMSAFISQMQLALLMAFIITFPFFLYKIIQYLAPALKQHEKKLVLQSLLPSAILFFAGCIFSYFVLIPGIFRVLYPYAALIGATAFFSVSEFISSVLGLMIATGVMFLLPLFMFILSMTGLVKPMFWKSHSRHALLFFLIFTAILIPDPTGVTMMILIFPLMGLYFTGCVLTSRFYKSKMD